MRSSRRQTRGRVSTRRPVRPRWPRCCWWCHSPGLSWRRHSRRSDSSSPLETSTWNWPSGWCRTRPPPSCWCTPTTPSTSTCTVSPGASFAVSWRTRWPRGGTPSPVDAAAVARGRRRGRRRLRTTRESWRSWQQPVAEQPDMAFPNCEDKPRSCDDTRAREIVFVISVFLHISITIGVPGIFATEGAHKGGSGIFQYGQARRSVRRNSPRSWIKNVTLCTNVQFVNVFLYKI